ncbi:SDR family oxidoreductase [Rhizorhabdus sp.]|uniref:SDR family NAD(P)-dependent oxidoreductase n=1 Tax=Rhizorhabdus sp. TaxID=1968843 RepID=UPI0019B194B2|nr:SDR family oxidoreductase [Rhizorhabdus sp.]MBD3760482.1 SDR family oxidoreductase [Rhizorhabdus sp.]
MAGQLDGEVAIVTGGESGIGAACARALAAAGAAVGILYLEDAALAGSAREAVEATGARSAIARADVGNEADVERAFATIGDMLGPPALLINSAGINMRNVAVADMDLAQWEHMLRTDLTGTFLTSRRLVRTLRAEGRPGRIVNISSIHGQIVRAGGADYCAAKAGLENLTRTMAIECAPNGITVNAIAPGMILTPMNMRAQTDKQFRAAAERHIPVGRAGHPEEVAAMAVYLCSKAAAYVTGAILKIDGGLSLEAALGA